jgi:hypothetical protein
MYKDNRNSEEAIQQLNSKIKRFDIINYLIEKNSFVNYLEIGVFHGENIRKVKASHKDGVDPGAEGYIIPEVNYPITSDAFFDLINGHTDIKYDVIFIDGLHHSDQVTKDIENSLKHLVPNGYIVLHDCNPISYESQLIPRETIVWNGDVWKSILNLRLNREDLVVRVVDTDFGVGIVSFGQMQIYKSNEEIDWEHFQTNKLDILNLISFDEFIKLY